MVPEDVLAFVLRVLYIPAEKLDLGFSLHFQEEAWDQGATENSSVKWLTSDPVQAFLERLVLKLQALRDFS